MRNQTPILKRWWFKNALLALSFMLIVYGIALIAMRSLPQSNASSAPVIRQSFISDALNGLNRYDAAYYQQIARVGYGVNKQLPAFFPLYPLVLRIVALPLQLIRQLDTALRLASIVVAWLILWCLLCLLDLLIPNSAQSWLTKLIFLAFPYALFLIAPYTEGLFALLMCAIILFARQRRWGLATCMIVLIVLTRLPGIVMISYLGIEILQAGKWQLSKKVLSPLMWLALPVIILGVYFVWTLRMRA